MKLQLKEVLNRGVSECLPKDRGIRKCSPEMSVLDVIKILQDAHIGSILVIDGNHAVGIFTERDCLMKILGKESTVGQKPVSAFMTVNPVSVARHETVGKVLLKMQAGNFRHIVVVDSYGNAENILSMRDIVRFLTKAIEEFL